MVPLRDELVSVYSQLPLTVNLSDSQPVRCSTFSDIYVLKIAQDSDGDTRSIAVKSLRQYKQTDVKVSQWMAVLKFLSNQSKQLNLEHDNLEPFRIGHATCVGVTIPAIVLPWYLNSNVLAYLSQNSKIDKIVMVCQLASAVCYLHAKGVIHGNICPSNVLVADHGIVRLTDVGVSSLVRKHMYTEYTPVPATWMYKPREELMHGIQDTRTDTYSFGSTVYAIFSLLPPYQPTATARGIFEVMTVGHRKTFEDARPATMDLTIWSAIQQCWAFAPEDRPAMSDVFTMISNV
ncbi:hypothetical protein HWV62_11117 [Athelia sp. TMB]|nr:hypothetical protein HWV62_11117 [Athelia sp. TMB]